WTPGAPGTVYGPSGATKELQAEEDAAGAGPQRAGECLGRDVGGPRQRQEDGGPRARGVANAGRDDRRMGRGLQLPGGRRRPEIASDVMIRKRYERARHTPRPVEQPSMF